MQFDLAVRISLKYGAGSDSDRVDVDESEFSKSLKLA